MRKKLSEYTLGEMKEICQNTTVQECDSGKCIFCDRVCVHGHMKSPEEYLLTEKIVFTDEEVETAKVLAKCFGAFAKISRLCKSENARIHDTEAYIRGDAFPSLKDVDVFILRLGTIIENKGLEL